MIKKKIIHLIKSFYYKLPIQNQTLFLIKSLILENRVPFHSKINCYLSIDHKKIRFINEKEPTVSIIIPVFNKIEYTLRCLYSIYINNTTESYEVIVVNDASSDDTEILTSNIHGLIYIKNSSNMGFLQSCNIGAKSSRGEYLCFLNNDTCVQPGWLDELVDTFRREKQVGLVGSKLVYPNGLLQEAGGIIWNDGTGYNYGIGDDANKPEYNYMREVDYCSGASIMVNKDIFENIGGFDKDYIPAYYEDVDLAFKISELGYKVLYQPLSKLMHHEGVSSGSNLRKGIKQYQEINHKIFVKKWDARLKNHGGRGCNVDEQKERTISKRVLLIDACTPMPDKDSGSVDAFYLMKILHSLSCKVTFIPEDNLKYLGEYTQNLQRFGVECIYEPYVNSTKDYLKNNGSKFNIVILSRVYTAANCIKYVKQYCPQAKIIFNTVDLNYLRLERLYSFNNKKMSRVKINELKDMELSIVKQADSTIVISNAEKDILKREVPKCNLYHLPLIMEIYNRHDTPFENRKNIIFVGGFQHHPNIDAVHYFVNSIWPLLREKIAGLKFYIIGSNVTEEIKKLDGKDDISVIGYVEDLSDYFNSCKIMVSSLRYGAGIKGKIGRSLGYGVPCVATSMSVEGMSLENGENIIVEDNEERFANAVKEVYSNKELWNKISQNGLRYFENNYSIKAGTLGIENILKKELAGNNVA